MADVYTGRKRKSSANDMVIEASHIDCEKESAKDEDANVSVEPLSKCPRKSPSPTTNLENKGNVDNLNDSQNEAFEVIDASDSFIGPAPKPESNNLNSNDVEIDVKEIVSEINTSVESNNCNSKIPTDPTVTIEEKPASDLETISANLGNNGEETDQTKLMITIDPPITIDEKPVNDLQNNSEETDQTKLMITIDPPITIDEKPVNDLQNNSEETDQTKLMITIDPPITIDEKPVNDLENNSEETDQTKPIITIAPPITIEEKPVDDLENNGEQTNQTKPIITIGPPITIEEKPVGDLENNSVILGNNSEETDQTKPIITINFINNEALDKYKATFLKFINTFIEFEAVELNNTIFVNEDKTIHPADWIVVDNSRPHSDSESESISPKSKKRKHKSKVKKELFMVDTTPAEKSTSNLAPKYNSKFKALDSVQPETVENVEAPQQQPSQNCWNCSGNHNLRDCPDPRDFAKIRVARNKLFGSNTIKVGRYHLEEEQKFSHLKPGQLSERLRHALGMGRWQIPAHIYKMRVLGYPPGWLEEAKIVNSNISLFDMDGKNVKGKKNVKAGVDPEKVIAYPGFNVRVESGFRDECNYYKVPPFSEGHSKLAMINFINQMEQVDMEDNLETCDMEIDANSDKEGQLDDTSQDAEMTRISPSLTDLEIKKKLLLAELISDGDDSTGLPECDELHIDADTSLRRENNSVLNVDSTTPNNRVKTSVFGTPILKSKSPFSSLPNADNFSKDVSPVINFENLPNSTGKYEQMTNVLDKVRKTLKDLHEKT